MDEGKLTQGSTFSWFDEPAKQSVNAVFDGLNKGIEALDIFKKYRNAHFKSLKSDLKTLKIMGMSEPINLVDIYNPARVSTTIHSRLYKQDWHSVENDSTDSKKKTQKAQKPKSPKAT